jgi:hypothetical protein
MSGDWVKDWLEESDNRAKKLDESLAKISSTPSILQILKQYNNSPERLKDIYQLLVVAGTGESAALSIIREPKGLSQFLQLESEGMTPLEIAANLMGWR